LLILTSLSLRWERVRVRVKQLFIPPPLNPLPPGEGDTAILLILIDTVVFLAMTKWSYLKLTENYNYDR